MIAAPEIIERVKKVHDFLTVGAAAPLMEAAVAGLNLPYSYYEELAAHYTHMKDLFLGGLKRMGVHYTEPQGAYYVLVDIDPYRHKGESDYDFCVRMVKEVGVAAVPGSSFFREDVNNLMRLHFAKSDAVLLEALNRLEKLK